MMFTFGAFVTPVLIHSKGAAVLIVILSIIPSIYCVVHVHCTLCRSAGIELPIMLTHRCLIYLDKINHFDLWTLWLLLLIYCDLYFVRTWIMAIYWIIRYGCIEYIYICLHSAGIYARLLWYILYPWILFSCNFSISYADGL